MEPIPLLPWLYRTPSPLRAECRGWIRSILPSSCENSRKSEEIRDGLFVVGFLWHGPRPTQASGQRPLPRRPAPLRLPPPRPRPLRNPNATGRKPSQPATKSPSPLSAAFRACLDSRVGAVPPASPRTLSGATPWQCRLRPGLCPTLRRDMGVVDGRRIWLLQCGSRPRATMEGVADQEKSPSA